jgi:homoserine dehydrogenase
VTRPPFRLALIGFGNVGHALVELLVEREAQLASMGIEYAIVGLATRRLGFLTDASGLDGRALVDGVQQTRTADFDSASVGSWLEECRADVLFELSSLEPFTGEPATSHIAAALSRGIHVVTANKGPLVHDYARLEALAQDHGVRFRFEAATADSVPVYSTFRETLPLSRVAGLRGVLNSTTSVILEAMESGSSLEEGVRGAQALGITETDPSNDIDGIDAAVKLVAIANVLMGAELTLDAVERVGIRGVGSDDLRAARAAGENIRLVGRIDVVDGRVRAQVSPERLGAGDPLNLDALSLALHFEFAPGLLPALTLVGHRLDPPSTAYGALCDFISIARNR